MFQIPMLLALARYTFSLTCNEVLEIPENSKLKLHDLRTIQPKDIVDCLSHLGREELTLDEAELIWNSIVQFHDGIANIPDEVLMSLHYVTIAIQPEEYANITLGNVDVIRNFGFDYGLNNDQLAAIADRVREDFGNKEPEDYTKYDLQALGQILCAFNRSEVDRIRVKAYKEAADRIGKLKNCNAEVMQGFAQLAVQSKGFGPPSLWTNATMRTVGGVSEYLPIVFKYKLKEKLGGSILRANETVNAYSQL